MIDDLRVLWDLHSVRREEYSLACWRMRCARDFSPSARSWSSLRWWPSWSGAEHPPRPQTARRGRRGASRTCRASGPTNSIRLCSAPPGSEHGSSSPRRNGPSWTRQRLGIARSRPPRRARDRARRGRRLQLGLHVDEAHRPAHVAHRRSAGWARAADDAGGAEEGGRRPRVPARAAAIDRNVQEQLGRLRRRQVRSDALAAARRAAHALQHRAHESPRRSGGRQPRRIAV